MKQILILISIFHSLLSFSQDNFTEYLEKIKDQSVAEYHIDLNHDNLIDTIKCKFPSKTQHPDFGYDDPGTFNILEIAIKKGERFILSEPFDSIPHKIFNKYQNSINSNLLIYSDFGFNTEYLIAVGPPFGCCIEKLYVLRIIDKDIKVINKSGLILRDIIDFDKDGRMNIIGIDHRGENWSRNNFEFRCLRIPKVLDIKDTLILNKELTYKYNSKEFSQFSDYLDYQHPVLVTDKKNGEKRIEEFDDIKKIYYRDYPFISKRKLDFEKIHEYNSRELRIMRNEIFAVHGYVFNSPDLREYFGNKKWYTPISKRVVNNLSEIEKYNVRLILEREKELNAP